MDGVPGHGFAAGPGTLTVTGCGLGERLSEADLARDLVLVSQPTGWQDLCAWVVASVQTDLSHRAPAEDLALRFPNAGSTGP